MVHPFSYREAADFWGTAGDPELSVMLHALVGGTPAYLDMSGTSGPDAVGELDDWVVSSLLNPGSAMFRGGQHPVGPRTRSRRRSGLSLRARGD